MDTWKCESHVQYRWKWVMSALWERIRLSEPDRWMIGVTVYDFLPMFITFVVEWTRHSRSG